MDWCSAARTPNVPWRGLYSGVVLAGLGVGLAVGQGVAAASPEDSAETSQSDGSADAGPSVSRPAKVRDGAETDGQGSPGSAGSDETDAEPEAGDADADADAYADADEITSAADSRRVPTKSRSLTAEAAADDVTSDGVTSDDDTSGVEAPETVESTDTAEPSGPAEPADPAAKQSSGAAPTTVRSVVSARPVTVENIVTDVRTWAGLRPPGDGTPLPATPLSGLVESLWLAVRQAQYTWNNQRPTADVTISGPGPGGALTGSLNAVDYDDAALTYSLADGPRHGRVSIDGVGRFTYTPGAAASGRADQFTVRIDDTSGNPFHVHGLLGLLGIAGPTEVTVRVPASSAVPQRVLTSSDIDELVSEGRVEVSTGPRGGVGVIEGRFTDQVVLNAADAAAVLNTLAPALGASANFADASAITATKAGVGATAEHFYRFTETVSGIEVLGSEVILVTDATGQVTGAFNYYRGLDRGFDITPDASVDEVAEVRTIAGTAYLGSGVGVDVLETFYTRSSFTSELVVYTLDGNDSPSLAWRAVIQPPDTGDMSSAGTTYLIYADGDTAGEIIVTVSNAQPASALTVAKDWLGDSRTIRIDTTKSGWVRTSTMVDAIRNITTYKTSYGFWGLGSPTLPGKVVKRSLFGWDKAAVSAHANTALVYDYYDDVLGRTSFDDAGAAIVLSIKYNPKTGVTYANAFWDPTIKQFAYGDSGYLQAAVDIVAHEYTHAVVTSVVGGGDPVLDYGEPGALNEAYADILGMLVEGKTDAGRWLIGEDSDLGAIRNLANPGSITTSLGRYRDRYSTRYTGNGDDQGEHVNSTIFGHAAYLMMSDAATVGISDETWAKVFYHSLGRLSANAKFVDGRAAVLGAASAQGLSTVQRAAIATAFDTVEIYGAAASSVIAV